VRPGQRYPIRARGSGWGVLVVVFRRRRWEGDALEMCVMIVYGKGLTWKI